MATNMVLIKGIVFGMGCTGLATLLGFGLRIAYQTFVNIAS